MKETTKKVIIRLKEAKERKGLTCQQIVDLCEQNNKTVSPSTVRRFFAKGSEDKSDKDFRAYTINAIFEAVIGTEDVRLSAAEEAALDDTGKELVAENAALKAVVEMRDAAIADLTREVEALRLELARKVERLEATIDLFRLAVDSVGRSPTT